MLVSGLQLWSLVSVGALLTLIIYLIVAQARVSAERQAGFREWAVHAGFTYSEGPVDPNTLLPFQALQPHDRGINAQYATNIATGHRGPVRITVFDLYQRSTHGGEDDIDHAVTTTDHSTIAVLHIPTLELPHFRCVIFGKAFTGHVEPHTIQLNPGCLLQATDPESLRRLFTPALLAVLEKLEGFTIVGDDSYILIEHAGKTALAGLDAFLQSATAIAGHLASP